MVLPEPGPITEEALADLYDWPRAPWLRACMALSLDGGVAGPDGRSASISSPADRQVMSATRIGADAYLVGAQTVRVERYSAVRARPEVQELRASRGQRPAPTLVVVSASCRFDWSTAVFQDSDEAPIILTSGTADELDQKAAVDAGCRVEVLGERQVDVVEAVRWLREQGLLRISAEGGPRLLSELVAADLVDEMDLTVSPNLVAGPRPAGVGHVTLLGMRLAHVLESDGFLFTRYVRPDHV